MRNTVSWIAMTLIGAALIVAGGLNWTDSGPVSGTVHEGTAPTANSGTVHAGTVPKTPETYPEPRLLDEYSASVPKADLRGKITGWDGTPGAGAEVFLYYSSGEHGLRDRLAGRVKAGPDGAYEFKGAYFWDPVREFQDNQPPQFVVLARHDLGAGFKVLLRGDPGEEVDFILRPWGYQQNVNLKDESGRPVAGAKICFYSGTLRPDDAPGPNSWRRTFRLLRDIDFLTTVTDAAGHAVVRGPTGSVDFMIEKPGYLRMRQNLGGQVMLAEPSRFSGRVAWPDGRPAAQVALTVRYISGDRRDVSDTRCVLTDARGEFDIQNMDCAKTRYGGRQVVREPQPGMLQVRVGDLRPDTHCVDQYIDLPIKPGEWVKHDFTLERGVAVSGRLIDAQTSAPLAGVRIFHDGGPCWRCEPTDEAGRIRWVVRERGQGLWRVEESPEGAYLVNQKLQPSDKWNVIPVGVKDLDNAVLKAYLRPLHPLAGCVLSSERVNGGTVYVDNYISPASVDMDGQFEFPGVPADGEIEVLARSRTSGRGGVDWFGLARVRPDQDETTITLAPGETYDGSVEDQEGKPVPGFPLMMYPIVNGSPIYNYEKTITSGPDGSFTANIVPGLKYGARWATVWNSNTTTQCDDGEAVLPIDPADRKVYLMVLRFPYLLRGQVTDSRGEPVANARVSAQKAPRPNHMGGYVDVQTGRDGKFTISNLDLSTFTLRVWAEDIPTREVIARAGVMKIVLEPPPPGPRQYTLTAVDAALRPVPNAPLKIRFMNRNTNELSEPQVLRTDPQGRAVLTWSPPPGTPAIRFFGLLECDLPGYSLFYRTIQMDKEFEIRVPLHKQGPPYNGRVVNEKKEPVAGARIELRTFQEGGTDDTTDTTKRILPAWFDLGEKPVFVTDRDGYFELPRFSLPDSILGQVHAEGYADEYCSFGKATRFSPKDRAIITVSLRRGGSVRGRLEVEGGLEPLGKVEIGLRHVLRGEAVHHFTPAGPDGAFEMKGIEPGEYHFFLTSREDSSKRSVILNVPEETTPVVKVEAGKTAEAGFKVEPSYKVRGRVVEAGGRPLAETENIGLRAIRGGLTLTTADARTDGTWEMFLPAGEIALEVWREGRRNLPEQKRITVVRGQPAEITIEMQK